MTWYYKTEDGGVLASTDFIAGYEVIDEEEYHKLLNSFKPTEEEIRQEREEELHRLLRELYPEEE